MLQQYNRIMVAVDGSKEAELAFKKAINVTKRNNAELVLLHVIDARAFQTMTSFDTMLAEQATDMAKESLAEYEETAKKQAPIIVEAQKMLLEWEQENPEVRQLWQTMNEWVYAGFNETHRYT